MICGKTQINVNDLSTHIYSNINDPLGNGLVQQHGLGLSAWIPTKQPEAEPHRQSSLLTLKASAAAVLLFQSQIGKYFWRHFARFLSTLQLDLCTSSKNISVILYKKEKRPYAWNKIGPKGPFFFPPAKCEILTLPEKRSATRFPEDHRCMWRHLEVSVPFLDTVLLLSVHCRRVLHTTCLLNQSGDMKSIPTAHKLLKCKK